MRSERVLVFETAARLSLDAGRLCVSRAGIPDSHCALVDLAAVVIDTPMVEITSGLLQALGHADVAVVINDARHQPIYTWVAQGEHGQMQRRHRQQLAMPESLRAELWSVTVAAKLANQARLMQLLGKTEGLARLQRMASAVPVGDPQNFEGQGARLYWPQLFGHEFRRRKQGAEDGCNAALNFGYAMLRSLLARYIGLAGLHPAFGYGHINQGSASCLIDDLIEPYRPCVDELVATLLVGLPSLDSAAKRQVLRVLDVQASMNAQQYRLHVAVSESVNSLVRALEQRDAKCLQFPHGFQL